MKCIILADDQGWEELFEDKEAFVQLHQVANAETFLNTNGDAYFDFREECWDLAAWPVNDRPVFVAGVCGTLKDHHCPANIIRLNTWPGMLRRSSMECAADEKIRPLAEQVMEALKKKVEWLPDNTGMVSPRVLSMIINEAWFAFGEGVSSKKDIDTAMKLGTNYPLGPFEWGEKIGLHRIYRLLSRLSTDKRYHIAPTLLREVEG